MGILYYIATLAFIAYGASLYLAKVYQPPLRIDAALDARVKVLEASKAPVDLNDRLVLIEEELSANRLGKALRR